MRCLIYILLICPLLSRGQLHDSTSINRFIKQFDKSELANNNDYTRQVSDKGNKYVENWHYADNGQVSMLTINYIIDTAAISVACTEKYYFNRGVLIYAYESETFFKPSEGLPKGTKWSGDFYFSNGKLIDYVTLGHGKSELDNWKPEKEILERLSRRKAQLKELAGKPG